MTDAPKEEKQARIQAIKDRTPDDIYEYKGKNYESDVSFLITEYEALQKSYEQLKISHDTYQNSEGEMFMDKIRLHKEIGALKSETERLKADVIEVAQHKSIVLEQHDMWKQSWEESNKQNQALTQKLSKAKEALEYYANAEYVQGGIKILESGKPAGWRARAALAELDADKAGE